MFPEDSRIYVPYVEGEKDERFYIRFIILLYCIIFYFIILLFALQINGLVSL